MIERLISETATDPAKAVYEGIVIILNVGRDALIWIYSVLPDGWPGWLKVGLIVIAIVVVGQWVSYYGWSYLRYPWDRWRGYVLAKKALKNSPYGAARFAGLSELKTEGMLQKGGLFLGRYYQKRWRLFSKCHDLYHHGEGHFMTIAAPGGGKTASLLIPALLTAKEGSFVVSDPKGEITAVTRRHRATKGRVIYLNPYFEDFERQTGLEYPDSGFNPFVMIENNSKTRAQANNFARLMMVTDRRDSNSYFKDEGAILLSLFISWIVRHEVEENRNIEYLYHLVRDNPRQILNWMTHKMGDEKHDALLVDDARRYLEMAETAPQQWTGAISKAQVATDRYTPTSPLAIHTNKNGFDPRWLKDEDITVYILLPSEDIKTNAPWLNMVMGMLGTAVGKPGRKRFVTFLMDELPALGFLPDLQNHLREFRGAGMRAWLFSQSAAALHSPELYGSAGFKDGKSD